MCLGGPERVERRADKQKSVAALAAQLGDAATTSYFNSASVSASASRGVVADPEFVVEEQLPTAEYITR
ncbi:hypothetical protein BHE74_00038736 [Ensete ventricosum]|nr:hypothetical protein GW17_00027869 [Ensete ventricosum]RWW54671.1 hypothetical protein BHE74_00038736 [Ensete ventricosum]